MNVKKIILIFCFFAAAGWFNLSAQDAKRIDSLQNIVNNGTVEQQLEALARLEDEYEASDPQKAKEVAIRLLKLADKHDNKKWKASAYNQLGSICFMKGEMKNAENYFNQSLQVATEAKIQRAIQIARVNLSSVQRTTYRFDKAMENLQLVLTYFEEQQDQEKITLALSNIAATYAEMGNYERHNEYALKAVTICEKTGDKKSMGILLANLCTITSRQKKWEQSLQYGEKAVNLFREINNQYMVGLSTAKLVDAMLKSGKMDSIIPYTDEIIRISDKLDILPLKGEALNLQANYYLETKNYNEAKELAFKSAALIDTTEKTNLSMLYETLTETCIQTNDRENALKFFRGYKDNYEKITSEEWRGKVAEMEFKYQTEKKEMKIASLQKLQKFGISLTILGGISALAFIGLLVYRHRNQKYINELAEQKILKLEQEKQLLATQAVLDGETAERTRLARDLHDGLGGMLSAVKLNLFDMKQGAIIDTEDISRFDKVMELLDSSMQELRRVAHNMMPESLSRYGLKVSLEDFCNSFSHVKFHFYGNENRLEPKMEMTIYRVIHELVNNAVKHARAENINVQMIRDTDRISFIVQDDGIGFNPEKISSGSGLQNIENRINSVGGTINILSSAGAGTEITIDIDLNQPQNEQN